MNNRTSKIRFHWGHGIAVFISLFVLTFIFLLMLSSTKDFDLQTENYYQEELAFEEVIQKKNNVKRDGIEAHLAHAESSGFTLSLDNLSSSVKGTVVVYRPSSKHLDFEVPLDLDDSGSQHISHVKLKPGMYEIKIDFESEQTKYFIEKDFMYK